MAEKKFEVFLSPIAKEDLICLQSRWSRRGSASSTKKRLREILKKIELLRVFPYLGSVDLVLEPLGHGHRCLLHQHYKIIYLVYDEQVIVTNIADARQHPDNLRERNS